MAGEERGNPPFMRDNVKIILIIGAKTRRRGERGNQRPLERELHIYYSEIQLEMRFINKPQRRLKHPLLARMQPTKIKATTENYATLISTLHSTQLKIQKTTQRYLITHIQVSDDSRNPKTARPGLLLVRPVRKSLSDGLIFREFPASFELRFVDACRS